MNTEQIKEFGECRIGGIEIITIIGEIEGHEGSWKHMMTIVKFKGYYLFLIRLAVMFPVDWHLPR